MHSIMSYTDWLRRQVGRLEEEIRRHSVFDNDTPASPAQLKELRSKVVIHTYLKQQLLRRETVVVADEEYETQEFMLVERRKRATGMECGDSVTAFTAAEPPISR